MRIRFLPGIYGYLLTHPEAVEHVLQKQYKNYRRPRFFNRTMELLVGKAQFTGEGEFWLQHRRLMQPGPFGGREPAKLGLNHGVKRIAAGIVGRFGPFVVSKVWPAYDPSALAPLRVCRNVLPVTPFWCIMCVCEPTSILTTTYCLKPAS